MSIEHTVLFGEEGERQAIKYRKLCLQIAEVWSRGDRFVLHGAKEIALYVKKSEAFERWVFRQQWLPIHREGVGLCMDVEIFETYLEVQRYCAIHALNVEAELRRRGLYEPTATKKPSKPAAGKGDTSENDDKEE